MKQIQLTHGQFTIVDNEDYDYLMQWNWGYVRGYACRTQHFPDKSKTTIRMHRVIMKVTLPKDFIDHINHDTLDNRKENLRICSSADNMKNRVSRQKNNTSGYKGVIASYKGHWISRITVDGKRIYLGYFVNKEDAAKAYDVAAKELHGEFARLNFPENI